MRLLTRLLIGIIFVMPGAVGAQQSHMEKLPWVVTTPALDENLPEVSEYSRPQVYRKWLDELAACEGLAINETEAAEISYFVVNGTYFILPSYGITSYLAMSSASGRFIGMSLPTMWQESYVKHEYLHLLLAWNFGKKYSNPAVITHPIEYYGKCGVHLGKFDK